MTCFSEHMLEGHEQPGWSCSRANTRKEAWERMLSTDYVHLEDLGGASSPYALTINEQEEGCMGNLDAITNYEPSEEGWTRETIQYLEGMVNAMCLDSDMDDLQKAMEETLMVRPSDIMPTVLRELRGRRYFPRQPSRPFTFPKYGHLVRGSNQTFFQLVQGWETLPV